MFEFALHAGHGHPELAWIVVPAVLSFIAGLALGTYSDRLRAFLRPSQSVTTEK